MTKDQRRMQFIDASYKKNWAEKAKSQPPTFVAKHKNVNVDLKWPDDGKGKMAAIGANLTTKIGVA